MRCGRGIARLCAGAVLLLGPILLSGCSTNVGEMSFPAVHDMPPARPNTTLSDAEQKQAEQDLITARNGVEARAQQQSARTAAQDSGQPANTAATGATQSAALAKGSGQ